MAKMRRMFERDERDFARDKRNEQLISSLLHLQSCLYTYVSTEDMEKLINARKAYDSGQIDTDELLVVIQEARQNAEERQAIKNRPLEDLQQNLSRILAETESWPSPLRSGIRKRCETEQSWLDRMCDKASDSQTAEEITTRIKEDVRDIESQLKNLNDYFKFAKKNGKLPEEPTNIGSSVSERDRELGMTAIDIYNTNIWASIDKPHSHVINPSEYDDKTLPYLLLCRNFNCKLKHAHPRMRNKILVFDMCCDQDCDCFKHNKRPSWMPKKTEVLEQPLTLA